MTLNRPDRLNSYTPELEKEMRMATEEIAVDSSIRALVITGSGRAFSAGGDVTGMRQGGHWDLSLAEREERFHGLNQIVTNLHDMDKPTLAMVNGFAVGAGCNLAMACDQRVASSKARFGLAFINVALGDDMGGAWMLPRLVGLGKAIELGLLKNGIASITFRKFTEFLTFKYKNPPKNPPKTAPYIAIPPFHI